MKKIHFFYILFIVPILLFSQSKGVKGIILDENRNPLIGASILIKGTNLGTISDQNGAFKLNVPSNGKVIIVSYLGYLKKEVVISAQNTYTIQLKEDSNKLDEVVVVGYGTQRKSDLTGAITSIKVDENSAAQNSTVDSFLQGRVAGVQVIQNTGGNPGSGVSVKIRGTNSLRGNNEPLYVVDGVIISSAGEDAAKPGNDSNTSQESQNGLNGINPRDIENIEVLKDASATSIYGSRGANGVVLITTKKGKKGKTSIKTYITTSTDQINKKYDVLDGEQFAKYQNEAYPLQPRYNISDAGIFNIIYSGTGGLPTVGTRPLQSFNWQDESYRAAFSKSTGISFSGGSDNGNYYISAGYDDQRAIMEGVKLQKGNFSINLNENLSDKLTINTQIKAFYAKGNYAQDGDRAGGDRQFSYSVLYYSPLALGANGDLGNALDGSVSDLTAVDYSPRSWTTDFKDVSEENRYMGSLSLNYKKLFNIDGLSYKFQVGGDIRNKERRRFYNLGTYIGASANGYLSISNLSSKSYQTNSLLTYNKAFNKNHRINVVVGMTYDVKKSENSVYAVRNFSTFQFGVEQPLYGQDVASPLTILQGKSQLLSYLSRANYTFMDKYILTGTIRADGSSKFSKENRYSYFPSFSAAWRVNKEKFLNDSNTINDLKVRAGWGLVGNQGIGSYQTFSNYGAVVAASTSNGTSIGFTPLNIANPNLLWETTDQLNLGLDFGLWKNRLSGNIDLFQKKTKNLLLDQPLGPSAGFGSLLVNRGNISNKGVEVSLNGFLVDKKDFKIELGGNIGFVKNKIEQLGDTPLTPVYIDGELQNRVLYYGSTISTGTYFNSPANIYIKGEQIGLFYGYKTNGIYQTGDTDILAGKQAGDIRIIDQNGDGLINSTDRTIIGNPNPDFSYGGYLNLKYKSLSLAVQMNGVYGNEIANGNLIRLGTPEINYNNILKDTYLNAWRPDAQTNINPRIGYSEFRSEAITDRIIEDGSYFRISSVTLGYDLPLEKVSVFSRVNVFISGYNLFTFTKYSGYNPEITSFQNNGSISGVDWGGLPNTRRLSLGLRCDF